MATEPVLTIELDWTSKSGSADATIGFGEIFDLRLAGFDNAEVNGFLWLTLIQDSVPTETSKELWSYKTPEKVRSDGGVVTLEDLCIFTQEVEEVLRSQGGKGKLFLAIREVRDNGAIDYGVVRLTVTIGSYIKDPSSPEQLEGVNISELVKSLDTATDAVVASKDFAKSASESAKQAVLLLGEKQDKLTAGAGINITNGVISATGGGGSSGGGCQEKLSVLSSESGLVVNTYRPNTSALPYYFLAGYGLGDAEPNRAFYVDQCAAGVFIDNERFPFTKEMFSGGGGGGTPYLAIDAFTSCAASAFTRSIAIGGYARAENPDSIVIGEESIAYFSRSIVIGNSSCSANSDQILIGHGISDRSGMRNYVDSTGVSDAIMFRACSTDVFFTRDACNNYATMIGFKNSAGCYETKRIEDAFTGGGGGDSYIKSSQAGTPYDIPGCSSGIAIGPNACIGNDVTNGLAIGIGVEATSNTPVRIGSGCAAITVNSNYELCVGGKLVGGGGGSSNDSICVYDSVGYCAMGFGANYVAIGDEAIAYSDSVAVGIRAYAKAGEVSVGPHAGGVTGNRALVSNNAMTDVRFFRACTSTLGNELFFATKDGKAVLGGEFSKVDGGDSGVTTNYCYFYLQDVADMLANGGGGSETSVMVYDDGFTIGTHTADGALTTGISYNNKNAQRNANQMMIWLDGEQISREQLVTTDTLAEYAKPAVKVALINEVANSYAYIGSFYQGQPVEGLCIDTVNSAIENGGKIGIQFYVKATGSSFGELKEETFVPSLENFNALAERVAELEAQLAAATAILESNLCVSGVEPIANENGTEVNYSQNPTGLLEGDELL